MSTVLDFDKLHIEGDNPDAVVEVFQKCELKKFLDDGIKRDEVPPIHTKAATWILVFSSALYIFTLILICIDDASLHRFDVLIFALGLLFNMVIAGSVYHLLKNKFLSSFVFLTLLIITSLVAGLTDKNQAVKELKELVPLPSNLTEHVVDTL